jgi:hypothetical protein
MYGSMYGLFELIEGVQKKERNLNFKNMRRRGRNYT